MNANEAQFIGHEQAKGDNTRGDNMKLIVGSTVKLKCWPVPGKVIGFSDGHPIIELEPCAIPDVRDLIVSYTDAKGLTCLPFGQRFISDSDYGTYSGNPDD